MRGRCALENYVDAKSENEYTNGLHRVRSGECVVSLGRFLFAHDLSRRARIKTVWPSGLRRWLQAPVRKGVGSNPTAVNAASRVGLSDAKNAMRLQSLLAALRAARSEMWLASN